MRNLILLSLILFSSTSFAQIEEAELLRRMAGHITGVITVCEELLADYPSANRKLVLARCRLHDSAKVNQSKGFLEKHGLSKEQSQASQLAKVYGRSMQTDAERAVVDTINRTDDAVAGEINRRHNATAAEIKVADEIEHLADIIERPLHEKLFAHGDVYEFGKPLRPATEYLANSPAEKAKWSDAQRERMIRIAAKHQSSESLKLKLIKSVNEVTIERRLQSLQSTSHFHYQRQRRAECFEALLHAPLPGA